MRPQRQSPTATRAVSTSVGHGPLRRERLRDLSRPLRDEATEEHAAEEHGEATGDGGEGTAGGAVHERAEADEGQWHHRS